MNYYKNSLDLFAKYPCAKLPWSVSGGTELSKWGIRCNAGISGEKIQIQSKSFSDSLVVHAPTKIRYLIPERKFHFKALAAIPDYIPKDFGGSVVVTIRSGGVVFQSSGVLTPQKPFQFDTIIQGVREFSIEITDAGDGDIRDHVVLADLHLTPH